jgi:hypothetical protein
MPCETYNSSPQRKATVKSAIERLAAALAAGTVTVAIGPQGAIAFKGWAGLDRVGVADVCAYRRLVAENSPALRRAVARAEVMSGRKVDAQAIAAGMHSHDDGRTWGAH